jgi:hypothetical protein
LKREKAVAIYKQIMNFSEGMGTNAFNLNRKGQSDDYEIRIRNLSNVELQELTEIARNNDLLIKQENGEVILYTP